MLIDFHNFEGDLVKQSNDENDSFYSFFQNTTQLNGHKGFVGFGLRELSQTETQLYCNDTQSDASFSLTQIQVNFTNDFMLRAYTSGCYYYDTITGKWSSHGMEIYSDTNLKRTHCSAQHLTSFAGGLIVLPPEINFQYVFANASFTRNPFIYTTVIVVACVYILLAVWSRHMDIRDLSKLNVFSLGATSGGNYFYEVIVFTGNRSESGTQSKV
jgi:hypothetical protein